MIAWPHYSSECILLKMCRKIKKYIITRAYKDIKSLKEDILDQRNNLDDHIGCTKQNSWVAKCTHELWIMEN